MEATQPTPDAGEAADDLTDLLVEPGPFLSVRLTTDPTVPNASQTSELRWKSLRSDLADDGVPEPVLAAVDPLVPDAHLEDRALAVVANAHGALHVEHGDDPRDPDDRADGRWGPLPWLFPVLTWRQRSVPHLVVVIDRRGADLFGVRREGSDVHREVESDRSPIRRSKPGGWSQRRYQQRAENSWERGAGDVSEAVAKLAAQVDPELIVVAGDVRAVGFLVEALPTDLAELVEVIEGEPSRREGVEIPDEVSGVVEARLERREEELLAAFDEEQGQGDLAAEGPERTALALAKAQVEVLLIRDDADDDRPAWFGPDAAQVGVRREHVEAMGVAEPEEDRLRDALVRAALGTSARVHVLRDDAGPRDGIGAILRWSDR
jgi:hypothetical protein